MAEHVLPTAAQGVIPALDVDSADELRRLVAATCEVEGVVAYKLGLAGALRLGLSGAVAAIREFTDLPVIYDHQKAGPDVPSMGARFVALCREAGIAAVILFPLSGRRGVHEFAGQALAQGVTPIVGGDLPFADYHVSGGGYVADDALTRIFATALDIGVTEFVIPANEPAIVARHVAQLRERIERPALYLPGIGPLGGTIEDAFAAAPGCRRYAIVGRAIAAAADPHDAACRLAEEALRTAAQSGQDH